MPRSSRSLHKAVTLTMIAAIILMSCVWALKAFADHRTKDFIIDSFIMDQGIYTSRETAEKNVEVVETRWGVKTYCVTAVAYVGDGKDRISTTIVVSIPTVPYVLNLGSAKTDLRMVGQC